MQVALNLRGNNNNNFKGKGKGKKYILKITHFSHYFPKKKKNNQNEIE